MGGVVRVPTIDGDVDLTIPAGIQPEELRVLRNRGVVKRGSRSDKGDHRLTIKIEIPKSLTPKQKSLIIEALEGKPSNEQDQPKEKKSGFFDYFKSACKSENVKEEKKKATC